LLDRVSVPHRLRPRVVAHLATLFFPGSARAAACIAYNYTLPVPSRTSPLRACKRRPSPRLPFRIRPGAVTRSLLHRRRCGRVARTHPSRPRRARACAGLPSLSPARHCGGCVSSPRTPARSFHSVTVRMRPRRMPVVHEAAAANPPSTARLAGRQNAAASWSRMAAAIAHSGVDTTPPA
jgi:hypothetical protein